MFQNARRRANQNSSSDERETQAGLANHVAHFTKVS